MAKIVDYKIISDPFQSKVTFAVVVAIRDGWQPIGGVAYCIDGMNQSFCQAMVKYEQERITCLEAGYKPIDLQTKFENGEWAVAGTMAKDKLPTD